MAGLRDLPRGLRLYLVTVIAAGATLSLLVALTGPVSLNGGAWGRVALLVVLGALAERFTLHLTHKTAINVSTVVYLAAVLVLPASLLGLLAFVAGSIGQLSRRKNDPIEAVFNASQGALTYLVTALAYQAARDVPHTGPDIAGLGGIGVLVLTAAVAHALTTVAIAIAAGLHLGTNPLRIVAVTVGDDLAPEAAMAAMALPIAVLMVTHPALVPILALPIALVYVAIRETVRLRADTHRALADLIEVVELRDPYTAGHSRRVADLARSLALRLGLTAEEADLIESAGLVHDLGKVAIDPSVLTKPGRLTDAEFAEMRRHPVLGADVIVRFAPYADVYPLVRHHHERWDGDGYPDGVAGEGIPLGARILAVADTLDALTSDRPYRPGMSIESALVILADGAGTQWDPGVVDALIVELGRVDAPGLASPAGIGIAVAA